MLVRFAAKNGAHHKNDLIALQQTFPDYVSATASWCIGPITKNHRTVLAYIDGVVVGMWVFHLSNSLLASCGTYVRRGYKRKGIALALWKHGLRKSPRVKRIDVNCYSRGGYRLVCKVKSQHPKLIWDIGNDSV